MENLLVQTLETDRQRIWRWMVKLTAAPDAADDIVQEAYTIAWQKRAQLIDDTGLAKWLNAIVYNVYKRWRSADGRALQRHLPLSAASINPAAESELTRHERQEVLDQALDQLPSELRSLLIARYIQQRPAAELAQTLNVTENALAVRLHRGKRALRQIIEHGQSDRADDWQQSRIWCGHCGRARYEARLDSANGDLTVICPHCSPDPSVPAWGHEQKVGASNAEVLIGLRSVKSALTRLQKWVDADLRPALARGQKPCPICGALVPIQRKMPAFVDQSYPGVHTDCPYCQNVSYVALNGIASSTPQGRQFATDHPRHHILPARPVQHDGREMLQIRMESLRSAGTLDVLFLRDTYEIVQIFRDEQTHDQQ